jgi:hypothetical protein
VRWAVIAIACTLGACRPAAPPRVLPIAAGATPGFVARQKVVATVAGARAPFDAVVQYRGDRLVVLALTPMGTKAFAIEQRGATVSITPPGPGALPAPPEAILRDIHAAYFALPKAARGEGWHRTEAGGARWERWSQGRLHERVWGRRGDRQADRLVFVDGIAPGDLPRELVFDHPRIAVRLEIHTLVLTRDDGPTIEPEPGA